MLRVLSKADREALRLVPLGGALAYILSFDIAAFSGSTWRPDFLGSTIEPYLVFGIGIFLLYEILITCRKVLHAL